MITISQLKDYIQLKTIIAEEVANPDSGFQASRRHLSEGLAKGMTIAGETWTYSTQPGGYTFSNPRRRFRVFIGDQGQDNTVFTQKELVDYLRAFTVTEEINQIVVDMWLTHAAMRGEVEQVKGGWRVREK